MVAFITGGANGIGKNIALTFAKNGYDIAISYRSKIEEAQAVADDITAMGQKCAIIKADISKYDDVVAMFDEFKMHYDRLDVFINNAGLTKTSKFLQTTEKDFDDICNVDFKGAYFAMQNAAKLMIEKNIHPPVHPHRKAHPYKQLSYKQSPTTSKNFLFFAYVYS